MAESRAQAAQSAWDRNPQAARRMLTRGNTLAVSTAALLDLLAAGERTSDDPDLPDLSARLKQWAADLRAISSEDRP